jgi:tartrate-resistant acid phosphatase type 5
VKAKWAILTLFGLGCSWIADEPGDPIFNPGVPPKPLTFFVIGDWGRRGEDVQRRVAAAMNARAAIDRPVFIISTGDNFYDDGVTSLQDLSFAESFENIYTGENIKDVPWYVTLGNHDYYGSPDVEIAYSKVNPAWNLPARYHTHVQTLPDGGKVRFIFLDTSPWVTSYYGSSSLGPKLKKQDTVRQRKWLDSLTRLDNTDWEIVAGHHHIYTGGDRRGDYNPVQKRLEHLFEKNKVDVYFCGHEHDLQHLKNPERHTHYFVSGAGSELRETGRIAETLFAASIQGFVTARVTKDTLEVDMIDYQGRVLHHAEIVKE